MRNFVVALDGPAGSGKSSISKMVACKLGFVHIDTGAMYRAVTLEALRRKIHLDNEDEYSFLEDTSIVYKDNNIYLNGEIVNDEIRSVEVTKHVSTCCKFKYVRDRMLIFQRLSAKYGKVLMDGRDIGTVVLPNAHLKIFLTASAEVRAKRRYEELKAKGEDVSEAVILKDIMERDYKDSHREIAPLKMAEDAILLDSSNMNKDEVFNKIIDLINERLEDMEDFKMEDLTLPKKLRVKDKVEGTVVQIDDTKIYLDIQNFTEGVMHLDHYTKDSSIESFKDIVKIGDVIKCEVAAVKEEAIYLSRLSQISAEAFQKVMAALESQETITVKVSKEIKGKGYQVSYLGNTLFLPMSQAPQNVKVGQTLEVKVLEADDTRKNAVVSRRVIEQAIYKEEKSKELDSIQVGDVLTGKVVKVEKFGLFVRFNYNQGLLKVNQIAHTFTSNIESLYHVGDEIEVKVIGKEDGKLLLSRKALLDTPFASYVKSVTIGQTVKGHVANKLAFGLLIELADDVKGLLHSSEYSHNPNDNFNAFVKIGDEVECAILAIDSDKEKISLSRKALMDNPWNRVTATAGEVVDVVVKQILDNGLIVDTLGVDGFIPASEALTETQRGTVKDYFAVDDTATAEILEIKPQEWRLKLSIKRVKEKEERKSFEQYLNSNEDATMTIGDRFKDVLK